MGWNLSPGDLVRCCPEMGSLALYDKVRPSEQDLDGHVGDLTRDQLAFVIGIADTGLGREGLGRYWALLVVSGTQLVGWCRHSGLLRRA